MLNARIYRAALVPFVLALAVSAFSLGTRPAPLRSTRTTDAFDGTRAYAQMWSLARAYPSRAPGSTGDEGLARALKAELEALGGASSAGFSVQLQRFQGQTIDGERPLENVIAERPGSTGASPIVIVAHRDAPARGSLAELSGTATLLELARVFASSATKRTIMLVSTSGGSGGGAGAAELIDAGSPILARGAPDAAIVIGDLAAAHLRKPLVIPYSDGFGAAPLQLQRTAVDAITTQAGLNPGGPSELGQLAHLAFPLAVGEQGVLQAGGLASVLVQASGERGPQPAEAVSPERLEALGRSVLSMVDALDASPDVAQAPATAVVLDGKTLPDWSVSLLVLTLLLAPALAGLDAFARARRRRLPVAEATLWVLSCGLPFLACALFAYVLGALGIVEAPAVPAPPAAMPFDGAAATIVAVMALTFVLAWLLWGGLVRRLGWGPIPDPDAGALGVVLVLVPVGLVAWLLNPYTALLLAPAANLLLLLSIPELRARRGASLALVVLALLPLALLIAFYADQLGLGPGATAWMAVQLLAGGHVNLGAAVLWSAALGAVAAAAWVAAASPRAPSPVGTQRLGEVTISGPLSYAGPGSLGGTESALRR